MKKEPIGFLDFFRQIPDHRMDRRKIYRVEEILLVTFRGLDLAGSIVTIDAMGCQSAITEKIIENKADYMLALKGNQGALHEDVEMFFKRKPPKIKR